MKCPQENVISAYSDCALEPHDRQELEIHLENCSICRERLGEFEHLNKLLKGWRDIQVQSESHKMGKMEIEDIFDTIVQGLEETPQKFLSFNSIKPQDLASSQRLEQKINPLRKVPLAAAPRERWQDIYRQTLFLASRDLVLEFIAEKIDKSPLTVSIVGSSGKAYYRKEFEIIASPVPRFMQSGLVEWLTRIEGREGNAFLVFKVRFDESGWLEKETVATASLENEQALSEYLSRGEQLIEKLEARMIDESKR